jgi:hypothetical protein
LKASEAISLTQQGALAQGLLDLVAEHLSTMDPGPDADKVRGHLDQTLAHIRRKKEEGETRFEELTF